MNVINPLNKKNIVHDIALFFLGVWIVLNTAYEFLEGYTRFSSMSMIVFLGVGALWLLVKGRYTVVGNFFLVAMIIMELLILISIFYVPDSIMSIVNMYTRRFTTNVILVFIIVNLINEKKDIEFILNAFILGGVLLSVMFYNFYGEDILKLTERQLRIGEDFGNLNVIAQRCAFSAIFCLYYLVYGKNRVTNILNILAFSLCFSVILLSGSKKAVVLILVEVFYLFLSKSSKSNAKKTLVAVLWVAIISAVVIYIIMTFPVFSSIKERFEDFFTYFSGEGLGSSSERNRIRYINQGLEQFQMSPIFGNGMCYSYYMFGAYAHNNYVELLLNFGLMGFVTYYSVYVIIFKNILKQKNSMNIRNLFICIMLAFVVNDFGIVTYYDRYNAILLGMMSTYYCAIKQQDEVPEENGDVENG